MILQDKTVFRIECYNFFRTIRTIQDIEDAKDNVRVGLFSYGQSWAGRCPTAGSYMPAHLQLHIAYGRIRRKSLFYMLKMVSLVISIVSSIVNLLATGHFGGTNCTLSFIELSLLLTFSAS